MAHLLDVTTSSEDRSLSEAKYHRSVGDGRDEPEVKLDYARNLVRSPHRADILKGVKLLEELFYSDAPISVHDCLLYLSTGFGRLGDYTLALKFVRLLIHAEPSNREGRELEAELRRRLRREGWAGVGLVVGSTLLLSAAIISIYLISRRSR